MADLAILTPTRGRPTEFARLVKAVTATAVGTVEIWVGRDYDDAIDYLTPLAALTNASEMVPVAGNRRSLAAWTNLLANQALDRAAPPRYLASLGDDHLPRTLGWDRALIGAVEKLGGSGIAYGNDLFQGEALPTAWIMSADIVRALGWMMLPMCRHMYVDNAILAMGRELGLIAYCPDVIIEHLHPVAGKAAMDDSYRASSNGVQVERDRDAYEQWRTSRHGLRRDADMVRAALALAVQAG